MATRKKEDRLMYGQVPLPQVTKELAERQARKRQLRQPPTLAAVIPQARPYRMFKVAWGGLNKSNEIDTGQLSDASNIDMGELPYIVPCMRMKEYMTGSESWFVDGKGGAENLFVPYPYSQPCSIGAYEDRLFVIYAASAEPGKTPGLSGTNMYLDMLEQNETHVHGDIYTGVLEEGGDTYTHIFAPFNVYDDTYATVNGNTYRRLIISPYIRATNIKFHALINADGGLISRWKAKPTADDTGYIYPVATINSDELIRYWEAVKGASEYEWSEISYGTNYASSSPMYKRFFQPGKINSDFSLDYITVYNSRLFGVANGRVMASEFGNYAGWTLDTAEDINESNAWVSPAQSNTKASTDFTGITAFRNHVVCFKRDFIHEVYNTKNPFRLVDVYSDGTIDQRSIQDVNGNLFFVSETNVLVYTGGNPRIVGQELGVKKFTYAVSGTDNRRYFLFCKDAESNEHFYVYDTWTRTWSERAIDITPNAGCEKVIGFANNNRGVFMLGGDGKIYKLDSGDYGEWIDTDDDGVTDTFEGVDWSLETEFITRHNLTSSSSASAMAYSNVNIKHLKSIQLLAEVAENAEFKVYALYDGKSYEQGMTPVYDSNGRTGRLTARIKLRNTAHYGVKLRVQGTGYVKLYEIELYVEDGGTPYLGTGDTAADGSEWIE